MTCLHVLQIPSLILCVDGQKIHLLSLHALSKCLSYICLKVVLHSSLVCCSLSGQCCLFCLQLVVFLRQGGNTALTLALVARIQISLCPLKERNYCEGAENEDVKWPEVRGCCIVLGLINCT